MTFMGMTTMIEIQKIDSNTVQVPIAVIDAFDELQQELNATNADYAKALEIIESLQNQLKIERQRSAFFRETLQLIQADSEEKLFAVAQDLEEQEWS